MARPEREKAYTDLCRAYGPGFIILLSLYLALICCFLGLQLKHCEDPVVIDDGDGPAAPQDLEQERMSAESQSYPDAPPGALVQGTGLLSRSPGQPSEDLGMQSVL